jgi:hypothetical protein
MVGGVVGVGGRGEEGLEWGFEGDHRAVARARGAVYLSAFLVELP